MNEAINWYKDVVTSKYVMFSGRASRSEFWYFTLVNVIISAVLGVIDAILGTNGSGIGLLGGLYSLAVLLPSIAVSIRRLHDTNRSGWWLLIGIIPIVGWIILIVWYVQDSDPGENQYGANPKGIGGPAPSSI
jgi:uncharacterized membrane protein YhaH (DUF805 family)